MKIYDITLDHIAIIWTITRLLNVNVCSLPCKLNTFNNPKNYTRLKEHNFTSRNFNDLNSVMPPFFDVKRYSDNNTEQILEIGCGNGRALLEIQSMLPTSRCYCINKDGYGHEQIHSDGEALLRVAHHYNISLQCDIAGRPILPTVVLSKHGIQHAPLPFANNSFDLILSHHSLNQDKLHTRDSAHIAPRVARLLRQGGVASMMLLGNMETRYVFPTIDCSWFAPAKILNLVAGPSHSFTIMLYVIRHFVGLMIRRCSHLQTFHPKWGCIFESDSKHFPLNMTKLARFEDAIKKHPKPNKTTRDWGHGYYPVDYLAYLYEWLDMVKLEPHKILAG